MGQGDFPADSLAWVPRDCGDFPGVCPPECREGYGYCHTRRWRMGQGVVCTSGSQRQQVCETWRSTSWRVSGRSSSVMVCLCTCRHSPP